MKSPSLSNIIQHGQSQDSASGFTKQMYKGMLAIDQYVDTESDDIQALQAKYLTDGVSFTVSLASLLNFNILPLSWIPPF